MVMVKPEVVKNQFNIKDKVAINTGATGNLGEAVSGVMVMLEQR